MTGLLPAERADRADGRPDGLFQLARRAYGYGRPIVALYRSLHDQALASWSPEFRAPLNSVARGVGPGGPIAAAVPSLLVDEVRDTAWLDLRDGPVTVRVPGVESGATVSAWIVDLRSRVVAAHRLRSPGRAGGFLVAGPSTAVPAGAPGGPVVPCPTELCLLVVHRTVRREAPDTAVGWSVQPSSGWAASGPPAAGPAPLHPVAPVDVRAVPSFDFLRVLDWMLTLMPPSPGEERLRRDLLRVGIGAGALHAWTEDYAAGEELLAGLLMGMHDVLGAAGTP